MRDIQEKALDFGYSEKNTFKIGSSDFFET